MIEPVNDGVRVLCQRCAKSDADTVVDMVTVKRMDDAIRAAVESERRACALACREVAQKQKTLGRQFAAIDCESAIRARGAA